jgi:hypothetical protein
MTTETATFLLRFHDPIVGVGSDCDFLNAGHSLSIHNAVISVNRHIPTTTFGH